MRLIVAGSILGLIAGATIGSVVGYNVGAQATWALVTHRLRRQAARERA